MCYDPLSFVDCYDPQFNLLEAGEPEGQARELDLDGHDDRQDLLKFILLLTRYCDVTI